ncbi:DNA polymerase beta superfamily protein [Bacteroides sp. 519]|uniref:DNA polymerase beta superfamily protein n=1 Tax=Bacteroides sp. 519 TaxID=2302937 RepID=UPI0013D86DD1|nr:nucleotidyltransferase domain-containing protein [Bacteroides sp. 519]NDV58412.1 nucleotidyltransferase [Bacteroides sp. 519]
MTIQEIKEKGLLLFECISGSKAYGLDTPQSDTDLKGVFYLPKEKFYGLEYTPQINNETNDEVYYELGRFVELLYKNNPNLLEVLEIPADCILYKHPLMDKLSVELFLSKLCKDTFAGYAHSQIRKARGYKKKIVNPMDKERKGVLDFCYILEGYSSVPVKEWLTKSHFLQEQCGLSCISHSKGMYALFYDEDKTRGYKGIIHNPAANEVSLSSIEKGDQQVAYLSFNIEAYSMYCKEYKEYWEWVEERNDARYMNNQQHGKNYDSKNMMHTIRLLQVAEEILRDGKLNVRRTNREQLLNIKSGKMEYDDLLTMANEMMDNINHYAETSTLQDKPDMERIEKVLVEIREELYKA